MHRIRSLAFVVLILAAAVALVPSSIVAANWPSWRGPHGNGVCDETNLPVEFAPSKNVLWKFPLSGAAGATPVVWENHIFLTTPKENRTKPKESDLQLVCVSTEGRELWRQTVGHGNRKVRGDEGNSCSPSPVTDGHHVWSLMGSGDLACFDFAGTEIWRIKLQDRYGRLRLMFGLTSTPVLDGDRLYMQLIHGDGDPDTHEAVVVSLDKMTGTEIWKQKRLSDATDECESSYASPVIYDDGKLKFLLTHGADYVIAHRLEDGKEIWRCGGLNPKDNYDQTLRFIASPAVAPGIIVVPTAKHGPVIALRPDGQGDVTGSKGIELWVHPITPDVPSPLIHDGLVYLCRETGGLICLDAKTGKEFYYKPTRRVRHRASPVYADGKVYLTSRDGEVTVVKAGSDFKILATNRLGEQISASPVISGGRIYFRTFENLWAVGKP